MNIAEIKYNDIANGTGVRTALFVSGCRHACPGCFNAVAWDFEAGDAYDEATADKILESLRPDFVTGITVLGGEPMEPENQEGLVGLLERIHEEFPEKSIWMYSGFTWEELTVEESRARTSYVDRILRTLDVLVDGRWVQELYDITLRFRGSSNQRLIDVPASLQAGEVVLWQDESVYATHSWE